MKLDRTMRVLLVDDDPETLRMYRMALEGTADVITESSPAHALEQAKRTIPDVIVLDLAMPAVDGWQLCAALRNDSVTSGVPVLVLTAHDDLDVPARAIRSGVRTVLVKPCPIERFLLAIAAAAEVGVVQRHQQLIRRLYELFNDRRFAEGSTMFADGGRGISHPLRRDGYIPFANGWVGAFPDASMTVVSIEPDGDDYDVHVIARGTHLGDLTVANGDVLRPSKRTLRIDMRHRIRFAGDRIAASAVSLDVADLARQLSPIEA